MRSPKSLTIWSTSVNQFRLAGYLVHLATRPLFSLLKTSIARLPTKMSCWFKMKTNKQSQGNALKQKNNFICSHWWLKRVFAAGDKSTSGPNKEGGLASTYPVHASRCPTQKVEITFFTNGHRDIQPKTTFLTHGSGMPNLKCRSNELPVEENLLERKKLFENCNNQATIQLTPPQIPKSWLHKLVGW